MLLRSKIQEFAHLLAFTQKNPGQSSNKPGVKTNSNPHFRYEVISYGDVWVE